MPLSTFRGAPRAEHTVHEYDPDGRLVRSSTYHEAEWTDVDRALALALADVEGARCPSCGEDTEAAWNDENDGRFEVETDVTCYACKAYAQWQETDGKHVNPGVKPSIVFHTPPAD